MGDTNSKNKILVIILIFTLSIVVILGLILGYMFLFKKPSSKINAPKKKPVEKTIELKEFVVNLSNIETTYLKVNISIGYTDKKVESEINDKMSEIRDVINSNLMKKNSEDFKDNGPFNVKQELISNINSILDKGKITNVYFTDIIIQ